MEHDTQRKGMDEDCCFCCQREESHWRLNTSNISGSVWVTGPMSATENVADDVGSNNSSSSNDSGETQEAAVLSRGGVDLALVSSWAAEGQDDTELGRQRQEQEQTRRLLSSSPPSSVDAKSSNGDSGQVGRCLCSEEEEEGDHKPLAPRPQQKKPPVLPVAPPAKKSVSLQQQPQPLHIVPNVVQVSAHPQPPASSATRQVRIATGNHHPQQQQQQQQQPPHRNSTGPSKPILSRKNWNNTIDSSGRPVPLSHHNQQQLQHSASCLKRYGSQQSCRSATTLRSYVSTSRGTVKIHTHISSLFWPECCVRSNGTHILNVFWAFPFIKRSSSSRSLLHFHEQKEQDFGEGALMHKEQSFFHCFQRLKVRV